MNVGNAIAAGDGGLLEVTAEEARLTIEIIQAASVSSREGRTVKL